MTIRINENQTVFTISINTPNISTECRIEVFSPYSNTVLFDYPLTLIESNSRYTEFEADVPVDFWDHHWNGMYTYRVYDEAEDFDKGSFKLITKPGGDLGTVDHISDNENRQAKVVYRSNY